jgi:Protein of unknown function (DUF3995)
MSRGGTICAYGAAVVAFGYAVVSLYWAVGGTGLLSTVGGYAETAAQHGGAEAVVLGLATVVVKVLGGLLALALARDWARSWSRAIPPSWLLIVSAAASLVLIVYGAVIVLAGVLVLGGAIHPSGDVDQAALRWHTGVWDLWFLVWGILLAVATVSYWRANRSWLSRGRSGIRLARSR